jgi:CarD family transcriptional regulator
MGANQKGSDGSLNLRERVMHPVHGVGVVEGYGCEEIAGERLELIRIVFEDSRATLRIPSAKIAKVGIRRLATSETVCEIMEILGGKPKISRLVWARRSSEYQAKINSGNPKSVAEVVRDIGRNFGSPEQSFSERQIFEAALERLSCELAAIESIPKAVVISKIMEFVQPKSEIKAA